MRRTSRLFLVGVGSAIAIGLFANYRADHWRAEGSKAAADCKAWVIGSTTWDNDPIFASKKPSGRLVPFTGKLDPVESDCYAYKVSEMMERSPAQQAVLDASNARSRWETVMFTMIVLGILSAIPALWYFLLDRLREVVGAFRQERHRD